MKIDETNAKVFIQKILRNCDYCGTSYNVKKGGTWKACETCSNKFNTYTNSIRTMLQLSAKEEDDLYEAVRKLRRKLFELEEEQKTAIISPDKIIIKNRRKSNRRIIVNRRNEHNRLNRKGLKARRSGFERRKGER